MLIGVVSDTHDNVPAAERIADRFNTAGVEVVIHCGDVIAPPVLPTFEGFEVHGVLGNNDGEVLGLEAGFEALGEDSSLHGRFADLTFDETHIAVLHGESLDEVEGLAAGSRYDYVLYGHHHVHERRTVGDTVVLNPGAHFPTVPAEHRRVAVIDTRGEDRFLDVPGDL
ncbi:MAG: metallophosphoesterase [Halobacteriales archaeon]|nr:metallophosphoesterase [Halobacteriales archaeon]